MPRRNRRAQRYEPTSLKPLILEFAYYAERRERARELAEEKRAATSERGERPWR